jgi:hypothetical protein
MRRGDLVAAIGLLLPPGIVLGLYAYIGSFNRMLGDDYCTMYMGQRLGLLRSIWYWYKNWHGRFSANAADWLIAVSGPEGYPFYTFIFLALWLGCALLAIKKALEIRASSAFKRFAELLFAILLVFTTLRLTPDVIESLFWWGGVRSYLSPLIFVLLYLAAYRHFVISPAARTRQLTLWLLVSFGLAFFMGGFSETFTPVLVLFLAGGTGLSWLVSKPGVRAASTLFSAIGFLGAFLALLVMVLAPGNAIRRAYFPAPPDLFTIASIALTSYFGFFQGILRSPDMLLGLLGATLSSVWLGMRINQTPGTAPLHLRWIFIILFAGFLLTLACFPTAVYATSEPPPARTLIIPAFILAACFLASGFIFGEWLVSHRPATRLGSHTLLLVACGLIVFSSYGSALELYSMRSEHSAFAQKWDRVDAEIREAKRSGLQELEIPSMKNWADAEYPTDNPRYWPNECYSGYYGIKIVAPPLGP